MAFLIKDRTETAAFCFNNMQTYCLEQCDENSSFALAKIVYLTIKARLVNLKKTY